MRFDKGGGYVFKNMLIDAVHAELLSHGMVTLLTYTQRMISEVWFDSKQTLHRLEADAVSTRSRASFDPK